MPTIEQWKNQIRDDVAGHRVMIYAKGEKDAAQCGYSHGAMEVFRRLGVPFEVRNVLADENLMDAISEYTDWPTIPQIFIDGTFIGGCDIVTEMYESGEIHTRLGLTPQTPAAQ